MNILTQTDLPAAIFHLSTPGALTPATQADLPERVSDLPAFYYWKDAIVAGTYVHPSDDFTLNITGDRLDGLVRNFSRMRENGVGVPILMDHTATAESTLGWIVDVRREGDRLLELHQFLGEAARDIGLRNKVSLGIDPMFIDGVGHQYGEAIVHSAITPLPVVPGQGEFVPLELSMGRGDGAGKPGTPVGAASVVEMSSTLSQVIELKRDLALSRGGVDPAVARELFELLTQPANALLLSTHRNGGSNSGGIHLALAVFDALARNRPVPAGEITGLQVLSRVVPGDDAGDLRQRMIALASGGM